LIVGVGASAGGLAATSALLASLAPDVGVGVVVIMHLDPSHESDLAAILGRATALSVSVAIDGAPVEPGRVYVIPPGAELALADGALRVTPRRDEAGRHLPIDRFLRSLAEGAGPRAVAVVLSGTGSDGALGVQAVRAAGGATYAQDESAEHDGMPRAAASTGCVDLVLPPEAIGRELARLARLPAGDGAQSPSDYDALLPQIFALLRASSGADYSHYKRSSFLRRVQRRVQMSRRESLRDYVELLRVDPAEAAALAEDVLIHVTSFFRDPAAFEALKRVAFPRLLAQRPRDLPIRVWVPACSTGEELYSIAMCLQEFLSDAGASVPIKVFGTDLSQDAVERARTGLYLANVAQDVSEGRLARFFQESNGGYQIRRDLRDLCVFARHDVTRDPPFSDMDLISCRNLLIYLDVALQSRVLQVFHYALKPDGALLLGASESTGQTSGFAPLDLKSRLFARVGPPSRLAHDLHLWGDYAPGASRHGSAPVSHPEIEREADRAVLAAHAPPGVVVTEDRTVVQFRGDCAPYVAPSPGAASLDLLRLAQPRLHLALRQTLDEAVRSGAAARGVATRSGDGRDVAIEVIPFRVAPTQQRLYVVLFRDLPQRPPTAPHPSPAEGDRAAAEGLQRELSSTREYLQSVIARLEVSNEQLSAAHEEVVSSNEELHSTNEELQLAKEELQASNEELSTVNGELLERNAEALRLNDDLVNLLASAAIPIMILGRDRRIRRFTPAAGRALGLIVTDLGRPFSDLRPRLQTPDLPELIAEVQRSLVPLERAVADEAGVWHQLSVRPYLTVDGRVDGVTLALVNIDAIKRVEHALRHMLESASEPIVTFDQVARIQSANAAAHRAFGYGSGEMVGLALPALIPAALRERHLGHHVAFMAGSAPRPMAEGRDLVACRKDGSEFPVRINLAVMPVADGVHSVAFIRDVSEERAAEASLRDHQARLQRAGFDALLVEARERRRIAADLHDRIGQNLALVQIRLGALRGAVDGASLAALDECVDVLARSIEEVRTLTFDLSPPVLYDLGLGAALASVAERFASRHGLRVAVVGDVGALDHDIAAALYRVVLELLSNTVKHARCREATVTLARDGAEVAVVVADAGAGFDPGVINGGEGFGLFGVRERVRSLGGSVDVSSSPGEGCRVTVRAPARLPPQLAGGAP
jgi:two-component system CheB/CheR fusion protein